MPKKAFLGYKLIKFDDINAKSIGLASNNLSRGQNPTKARFLNSVVLLNSYWDFKTHFRQASDLSWYLQNAQQTIVEWALEKRNDRCGLEVTYKAKSKIDPIALNLKSYYEYHIWGSQKTKNEQNIPIGRGCMNSKNKAFTIGRAQCISDTVSKMASAQAKMRLGKKLFI